MERLLLISLSSRHSEHNLQVIEGFEKQVLTTFPEAEFVRYSLQKQAEENSKILQEIKEQEPFLVLTLGSKATRAGLASIPDVPLVASNSKCNKFIFFIDNLIQLRYTRLNNNIKLSSHEELLTPNSHNVTKL